MKTFMVAISAALLLLGCSKIAEGELKDLVKRELIDPESAQFRDIILSQDGACMRGKVNSKNRMGGYVGFRPFFASKAKVLFAETEFESSEMFSAFMKCLEHE